MTTNPFGFCAEPNCTDDEPPKDLPSFKNMTKNLLGTAVDVLTGVTRGEGVFVTEPVYTERMNICNGCEFFRKEDKRCTQCGCFMEAKTRLKNVECPIHKWGKAE
jgi:tRNA(Ile2) C34 agmatinyltransferase TiaS